MGDRDDKAPIEFNVFVLRGAPDVLGGIVKSVDEAAKTGGLKLAIPCFGEHEATVRRAEIRGTVLHLIVTTEDR